MFKDLYSPLGPSPDPSPNFVCSIGVQNDKGIGNWEIKWLKNQFLLRFCMSILKFSQKIQILIAFSTDAQRLPLVSEFIFLFTKPFQNSIKIALIFIKISFCK